MEEAIPNPQVLIDAVTTKMPFGKHKGILICDLPVYYLEWMHGKGGFPPGKLGMMLSTVFEIKTNGVGKILDEIKMRVHAARK
ncbi:DUF3820 family protein [Mucilaginibacter limnophilus]|uniref:DUF3820 family protein n=1 Tax=Mucilaginibacter limnophilus TaxID=1932778 RepID=UPI001F0CD5CF|nr:DUF3820 family protein [Mucilaginibacter limnophilus]